MKEPIPHQNIIIFKDTILYTQNDSIYINSTELKELSHNIVEIKQDFKKHLNKKTETFLGASYDTVFTVSVTITIFALGIIINSVIKRRQDNKEIKTLNNYFNNQLDELKNKTVPKLIDGYKKNYQTTISLDNGIPTSPPKVLTNTYNRLSKLESPILFKSFKNDSNYNDIFHEIDFIKQLIGEADKYHSISLERSSKIRSSIGELDSLYINKLVEYLEIQSKNNPNYKTNETYKLVSEKINYYYKNIAGKRNITSYYSQVIRPIQEHMVATNLFRTDYICKEIIEQGKLMSHKYNDLKRLYIEIRLQYRHFVQALNNTKTKLEQLNIK